MKVLVLGLPRTGTQSMADALDILGISPVYHMRDVGKKSHQDLWIQAIETKFEGKGFIWNRDDFEKILSGYEGLSDFPAAIFPEELIKAYPEASIILTTRSVDSWYESMMTTLWHHHSNRPANDPSPMAPMARKYHQHCWGNDLPAQGKAFFEKHNAIVREASKGRRFLEFSPGDGWIPLCQFLGLQVPDREYPRSDDWAEYKAKLMHAEEQ